jgi:hypothetical protein
MIAIGGIVSGFGTFGTFPGTTQATNTVHMNAYLTPP